MCDSRVARESRQRTSTNQLCVLWKNKSNNLPEIMPITSSEMLMIFEFTSNFSPSFETRHTTLPGSAWIRIHRVAREKARNININKINFIGNEASRVACYRYDNSYIGCCTGWCWCFCDGGHFWRLKAKVWCACIRPRKWCIHFLYSTTMNSKIYGLVRTRRKKKEKEGCWNLLLVTPPHHISHLTSHNILFVSLCTVAGRRLNEL